MLTEEEIQKGIATALETKVHAFAYKSEHPVGAAVISLDGESFGGCNVESPISGLGKCAEQCAIMHAVIHGHYEFKALVVVSTGSIVPCGECLEFLATFSQINGLDIPIILANESGQYEKTSLLTLLPHPYFTLDGLEKIQAFKQS